MSLEIIVEIILFIIGTILAFIKRTVFKKIYFSIKKYFSKLRLMERGYYCHEFLKNKIKNSNNIVRVMCVRNIRVTEPDIIEEIKRFITERNGTIEIWALSPRMSDEIISEIMLALPDAPRTVEQFRRDVNTNYNHIFNLYEELGGKKSRLHYFEYRTLPLIHACQFDDVIYLGFQLYHKERVEGSLLDYYVEITANSNLGKRIIEQLNYLKTQKSDNLFETEKYKEYLRKGHV